ncbi:MAG: hypothetical protein JXN60_05525 [Lentisphaerae bacterium]|nr:hypothetical protein [Lentisphaerota bacterium]
MVSTKGEDHSLVWEIARVNDKAARSYYWLPSKVSSESQYLRPALFSAALQEFSCFLSQRRENKKLIPRGLFRLNVTEMSEVNLEILLSSRGWLFFI